MNYCDDDDDDDVCIHTPSMVRIVTYLSYLQSPLIGFDGLLNRVALMIDGCVIREGVTPTPPQQLLASELSSSSSSSQ
jgi:hypothetical protein